ncbi:MAG: stage II sporulation protein E, partial [Ruminiclostridium sp.]|nr:stage II sporulation protein E [Ruminiclostridium sp.]
SQQFEGLSGVISGLAEEIDTEVNFSGALEDEAFITLNNAGVKTKEVVVYKNKWDKYEASIIHAGCGGARVCISTVEKTLSSVLGRQMVKESEECKKARDGMCILKLVEEENLKVSVSVAKQAKYGSDISGDNFTFMNTGKGKYFIALSDGMGSGYRAAVQSKATVTMLENFLESGFDKDMAVKLVNSVLVLKSTDDIFSTMDISVIDLFNGETEFVKIGAVPTYLKRNDRVEMVKSASLPAGIMIAMETELVHKSIGSGDMLIMMTDGVIDSFAGDEPGDRALLKFIQDMGSINPQQVADDILNKAVGNCEGKPYDDMTVIVTKVWKRYR